MNKILLPLLVTLFVLSTYVAQGQNRLNSNKRDRVESLRIAFITNKLNLTPEESTVFWPVYNKMKKEIDQVRKNTRAKMISNDNISEGDAKALMIYKLDQRQKEVDLTRQYTIELAESISPKKLMLLTKIEADFRKELLKEVRNRKR